MPSAWGPLDVLPDLLSNIVEVIKLTSLASVVSLHELAYAANMVRSVTYNASSLVLSAALYLALARPDIQEPLESSAEPQSRPLVPDFLHADEPEVELD